MRRKNNNRMLMQSMGAFVFSLALGFVAIKSAVKNQPAPGSRMPQSSVNEIYELLAKIEKDLEDPKVFNRETAINYIKNLTEAAYNLNTSDIYPDSSAEKAKFAETRKDWMERLFRIQLLLRSKMIQYHSESKLSKDQIAAFRNGNMYLSYAQDFVLMEWATTQDVGVKKNMFAADFPANLRNPKMSYFQVSPGDIILVRGSSFVSATIARSGDFLTNYSHVAMVIQDPQGNISIAEALMEEGIIKYDVDQYLSLERLSRAVVLRPKNAADGKAAALAAYKIVDEDLKSPVRKAFDMLMNPFSHDKIYCFELLRMAYDQATKGRITLPAFPMGFSKALSGNSFYKGMGNTLDVGAAPDDAFFQPEFEVVMVQRDIAKIKSDWAFDVAMSSIFEFIHDRYDYIRHMDKATIAKIALFIKNDLKIPMKKVPPGVPSEVIALIMEHKDVAVTLQTELLKQMDKSPRILAYRELEAKAKAWLETNKDKYFVPCAPKKGSGGGACGPMVNGG